MRIYKYSKKLDELQDTTWFYMPNPCKIVSVVNQNNSLCIYALVDENQPNQHTPFRIVGTGHPVDDEGLGEFIGTVLFYGGSLVFHIFKEL